MTSAKVIAILHLMFTVLFIISFIRLCINPSFQVLVTLNFANLAMMASLFILRGT